MRRKGVVATLMVRFVCSATLMLAEEESGVGFRGECFRQCV